MYDVMLFITLAKIQLFLLFSKNMRWKSFSKLLVVNPFCMLSFLVVMVLALYIIMYKRLFGNSVYRGGFNFGFS